MTYHLPHWLPHIPALVALTASSYGDFIALSDTRRNTALINRDFRRRHDSHYTPALEILKNKRKGNIPM